MLGETLGNYRIDSQIGSGGMGIVYSAEHILLGKRAAIKVLKPERCESQEIVNRFFNEARAAAMVKHPGIPEIFDYGHLPDGNAYIIMEMLEGETLGSILEGRTRLTPGRTLALARLMAGTLKATHEAGIIHRDLKPDNVFVVPDAAMPRGERIQILDFGIAKLQGNTGDSSVQTETGRLMGTPFYMSPEQCRGAGNIDRRTDIYSLGCVIYQMLCGRPPFAMRGSGEILAAHIHLVPQAPREVEAAVPERLESLVLKMLAKDPGDRPQSMADVIAELNQIATLAKMDTPEPSLATSMEMSLHLIQNTDNAMMDTVDDFGGSYGLTHDSHDSETFSGADSVLLLDTPLVSQAGTAAIRHPRNRFRKIILPLAVAIGVSVGAWTMWTLLNEGGGDEVTSEETAKPSPAELAPRNRVIVREFVEVPTVASEPFENVSLNVESNPSGAAVYRVADGVKVGITPLVMKVRRGDGVMSLLLRKRGYKNTRIELPVSKDRLERVSLSRKGKAEPESKVDIETEPVDPVLPDPLPESRRGQRDNPGKSRVGTWTE